MDKEAYEYTLNSLLSDCESLESAKASMQYLYTIEDANPNKAALTQDMRGAFDALYKACNDFLTCYISCQGIELKKQLKTQQKSNK